MAAQATGNMISDLERLNEEAERAGRALACTHDSADELHRDMVRRYFATHPRRRPLGIATCVLVFAAVLILF